MIKDKKYYDESAKCALDKLNKLDATAMRKFFEEAKEKIEKIETKLDELGFSKANPNGAHDDIVDALVMCLIYYK